MSPINANSPIRLIAIGITVLPFLIFALRMVRWITTRTFGITGLILVLVCAASWVLVASDFVAPWLAVMLTVLVGQLFVLAASFYFHEFVTGQEGKSEPPFSQLWRYLMGAVTCGVALVTLVTFEKVGIL